MEQETEAGYLEQFGNQGLEDFTADSVATSYLGMIQPGSQFETEETPAGTWRNSATGETYGKSVNVVVLQFKTIWSERDNDTFRTVGRYEPHSIKVDIKPVPAGKRGYPTMVNPATGNKVQELYAYAVMLPEHPEAGVMFLNPTTASMRACKSWNKQMSTQLFANGKRMPIFACVWQLDTALVPNPVKPTTQIAKLAGTKRVGIVGKDTFDAYVQPALGTLPNILAIADTSEESEASEHNEFLEN